MDSIEERHPPTPHNPARQRCGVCDQSAAVLFPSPTGRQVCGDCIQQTAADARSAASYADQHSAAILNRIIAQWQAAGISNPLKHPVAGPLIEAEANAALLSEARAAGLFVPQGRPRTLACQHKGPACGRPQEIADAFRQWEADQGRPGYATPAPPVEYVADRLFLAGETLRKEVAQAHGFSNWTALVKARYQIMAEYPGAASPA